MLKQWQFLRLLLLYPMNWYSIKKTNQFNDLNEMRSLTQIIKQSIYLEYKVGTSNL